jgi:hypothetical protein
MRCARCLQAAAAIVYFCACSKPCGGFEVSLAQSQEVIAALACALNAAIPDTKFGVFRM